MGWLSKRKANAEEKPKELVSARSKLVEDFVVVFAALQNNVTDYGELYARYNAIDGLPEIEFAADVTQAQEEFLDNSTYQLLAYGDPQAQNAIIEEFIHTFSHPLQEPPHNLVRQKAFDYEKAYTNIPPCIRHACITEEQYTEYCAVVELFGDYVTTDISTNMREYKQGYRNPDKDKSRSKYDYLFATEEEDQSYFLGQQHARAGVDAYMDLIAAHEVTVTDLKGRASTQLEEAWMDEVGVHRSHIRASAGAAVFLRMITQDYLHQLALMDSILTDSIQHIVSMVADTVDINRRVKNEIQDIAYSIDQAHNPIVTMDAAVDEYQQMVEKIHRIRT